MIIVVNSHVSYYKTTIPRVINALKDCGLNDIAIVVGGSKSTYRKIEGPIEYYFVEYNSFDFTAFICLYENFFKPDFFYMHDTCNPGLLFGAKLNEKAAHFDSAKLTSEGSSMNIGLYTRDILDKNKDFLLSNKFYPKDEKELQRVKRFVMCNEDALIKDLPPMCRKKRIPTAATNMYSDTPRIVEYFEELDLFRYRANWDEKSKQLTLKL